MANKQGQTLIAKAKSFIVVLFLQVTYAIMNIITKTALDNGLSNYVFVVYRHATAFIVITPFALYFEWYFTLALSPLPLPPRPPSSLKQYEKVNCESQINNDYDDQVFLCYLNLKFFLPSDSYQLNSTSVVLNILRQVVCN